MMMRKHGLAQYSELVEIRQQVEELMELLRSKIDNNTLYSESLYDVKNALMETIDEIHFNHDIVSTQHKEVIVNSKLFKLTLRNYEHCYRLADTFVECNGQCFAFGYELFHMDFEQLHDELQKLYNMFFDSNSRLETSK